MFLAVGSIAQAATVLWDYSPETTGATGTINWNNESLRQNFAESILFDTDVILTGMDIYSAEYYGKVGNSVTIRLWDDVGGQPGSLMMDFTETISIVDGDGSGRPDVSRKHVDFTTAVGLSANTTYWIGMSSTSIHEFLQMGLQLGPDDSRMFVFSGTNPLGFTGTNAGDMAFRLHGTAVAPVPVPAALPLFLSGLMGLGVVGWRKRRKFKLDA